MTSCTKRQRLTGIPETSDADVRARKRQLAAPTGIRVRRLVRLRAPGSKTTSGPAATPELYHIFMCGGDRRSWRLLAKSETSRMQGQHALLSSVCQSTSSREKTSPAVSTVAKRRIMGSCMAWNSIRYPLTGHGYDCGAHSHSS